MEALQHNNIEQLESLSQRLKYIIDTLGVKQSHMAEKLGMSPSGLHYILNNEVKFSKNAKKIVDYLNETENLMAKTQTIQALTTDNVYISQVPIYYPDQLKLLCHDRSFSIDTINQFPAHEYAVSTTQYKDKVIGLVVTESEFAPKFEVGDKLIFEQALSYIDGEILLIYLPKIKSITLKYGFFTGNEIILISYCEKPIRLTRDEDNIIILGGYRECYKKNNIV